MHASTSSLAVALVASATLFTSQVEALPMTRSSSSVARRAHLASHHASRAAVPAFNKELDLGDHAIVVDASSSGSAARGGIKNSTINLTSISHQTKRDSTLSGFSRVVRSLFGVGRRRSAATAGQEDDALPLTFSPSAHAAAPVATSTSAGTTAAAAVNPKRAARAKRQNKNTHASKRRARPRNFGKHPRPVVNLEKRDPARATLVVPVAARYITRQVKRGGATYTEAVAQASIYSAAIAALPETTATRSAAVEQADSVPTVAAYIDAPAIKKDSGSPYSGSALDAPNGSYGNAAAARAQSFSAPRSWASVAGSSTATSAPSSASVPTSTPLVSVDANGITWVQATALATPEPFGASSSPSSAAVADDVATSSTVINPKAAFAAAVPSSSSSSVTSPSAPTVPATVAAASKALPTSPPPSTMTGR